MRLSSLISKVYVSLESLCEPGEVACSCSSKLCVSYCVALLIELIRQEQLRCAPIVSSASALDV